MLVPWHLISINVGMKRVWEAVNKVPNQGISNNVRVAMDEFLLGEQLIHIVFQFQFQMITLEMYNMYDT